MLGAASDTHQTGRVPEFDSIDDQTIYRGHPEEQRLITDLVALIRGPGRLQYEAG
jgi:hypothetical protein